MVELHCHAVAQRSSPTIDPPTDSPPAKLGIHNRRSKSALSDCAGSAAMHCPGSRLVRFTITALAIGHARSSAFQHSA